MRSDAQLAFIAIGGPGFSLVGGAGVALPTNPLDLLGYGAGVAPNSIIGTQTAVFGTDFGVGRYVPHIAIFLSPTPTILGVGSQLNIQLQVAPDAGTPTYQPGTWQTITETGYLTTAQLVAAQTGAKQQPIRIDFVPNFPANENPRFMRLVFQPLTATSFTAGSVASAIITPVRDDYSVKFAQRNYSVA